MFKLALNAGHGNNTPGKRCLRSIDPNETREYILNKRICDLIQNLLASYDGIEILRIDDGSEMSIANRAKKANKFKANFYLAIHHNAGINGGSGGGIEAYTYVRVGSETIDWQQCLYGAVVNETGLRGNRSQPMKKADLGECRETNMPAVLLECGFMDSTTDTPKILTDAFALAVAKGCVKAIIDKAGLTKKVATPAPAPAPAPAPTPAKKTNEQIAREVIQGKWGNGAARKAKLKAAGYNYSIVQNIVNKLCKK